MTNWKYTKGTEKNFEGAPDWAKFVVLGGALGRHYFVSDMIHGGLYLEVGVNDDETSKMNDLYSRCKIIAQREPVAEWEGRGLPPVGAECEMQSDYGKWVPVDIIANHDGFSFGWSYDLRMVYFSNKAIEFRPIKSESERRRDEIVELMISEYFNQPPCETPSEFDYAAMQCVYDAIAAGKIPHVKLED